ncbi:MAG: lysophospholipid acyltransferase family protein [Myxococcota bacterium]
MDREIRREVRARLDRLELPFNRDGVDPYGVTKEQLYRFLSMLGWFYRHYFRARVFGVEHMPLRGRAMIVGNHSGGFAIDAGMIVAATFFELDPPRLAQGMADKFINRLPFASQWTNKAGQFTGLPEHAIRLLEDDRLLMVFPEGHRGTAKLFHERYSLVRFGTGFMRLALQTNTPIIPVAFLGGGEAVPTVMNLYKLGKLLGAPYIPITPYLLPLPMPVPVSIHFGEPMHITGTGDESDAAISARIGEVKERIQTLIENGRKGLAT